MLLRIMRKKQLDIVEAADYVGISVQDAKQILLQTTRRTEGSIHKPEKHTEQRNPDTPLMTDAPRNEMLKANNTNAPYHMASD